MKTSEEIIADEFERIIEQCDKSVRPLNISFIDKAIYYIVSVRAEMDGCGFSCVFDQLLTYEELDFLITVLTEINEIALADLFSKAKQMLKDIGFHIDKDICIDNYPNDFQRAFTKIENEIRLN